MSPFAPAKVAATYSQPANIEVHYVEFATFAGAKGDIEEVSHFHIAKNVSEHTRAMLIAINREEWDELIPLDFKRSGEAHFANRTQHRVK